MPLAPVLQQVDRTYVRFEGRRLSYFGGCDYYRLASDARVLAAVHQGADRLGLNVAASRATTGNHEVFAELEQVIARFFGVPAALLTASGYVTNLIATQALAGDFDHGFIDERAHPSLKDAVRFLDFSVTSFAHCDPSSLAHEINRLRAPGRFLVLTDGMFSHNGAAAPVGAYLKALPRNAMLLVDDAHGAGVLGTTGRGTPELAGVPRSRVIQTISLSKAFGAYGGAVLGSSALRSRIIERSRLYSGNTPLPLPLAAAALVSVPLLAKHPEWRRVMSQKAAQVKDRLRTAGLNIPHCPGPIVAVHPRNRAHAAATTKALLRERVYPSLIQYPGGPPAGYFRFMISSRHTRDQLDALVAGLLD